MIPGQIDHSFTCVVKSCVYKSSINWYNVAGLIFQKFLFDYTLDNYAYSILEQIGPR